MGISGSRALASATALALGTVLLAGIGASAASAASPHQDSPAAASQAELVLATFRQNLAEAGADAAADLARFDALTSHQRSQLADYFLGGAQAGPTKGNVTRSTSVTRTPSADTGAVANSAIQPLATTQTYSVWATSAFLFAGIKITETKVAGTYTASSGTARSILSHSCTVTRNYDPLAEVSTDKSSSYIASGQANLECRVRVRRGVPTPWGQISWSTKEAIQYLRANGYGSVVAYGWK